MDTLPSVQQCSAEEYERVALSLPHYQYWQSLTRSAYLCQIGRDVYYYVMSDGSACALVNVSKGQYGLTVWDIACGPLWNADASVIRLMQHIIADAKRANAMELYLSPHAPLPCDDHALRLTQSPRHIYATTTRVLDLTLSTDDILTQMHEKGRYNIRLSERKGVTVERWNDDNNRIFYAILQETSKRDGFRLLPALQYNAFLRQEGAFLLMALHDKKPIAGLMGLIHGNTGYYYYGASLYDYRSLMAPYVLQWHAMQYCKNKGCTTYDLLGEASANDPTDPWIGLTDFKRKFGGEVIHYPAERKIVLRPVVAWMIEVKRRLWG